MYLIDMTYIFAVERRLCDGSNSKKRCQRQDIAAAQCSKSPARWRQGRTLHRLRILRFSRYGAGQVRNAATRTDRWMVGVPGGKNVWLLSKRVLSSSDRFSAGWYMGIISRATRSSKSTQIYPGSHGFYRKISRGQQLVIDFGPSPITPGAIWDIGASTEYRTSTKSPTKKGLNPSSSGTKRNVIDKDGLSSRYEQLRSQALGQLFTSGQGLGLALFMRKGMAAWTHAWTEYSSKAAMAHFSETDTKNRFTNIISNQIILCLLAPPLFA